MSRNPEKCRWASDLFGLYICNGNSLPCERVKDSNCEMEKEYFEKNKAIIKGLKENG